MNLGLTLTAVLSMVFSAARSTAFADAQPPLVFIHGIKGARLIDGAGGVVWVSAMEALGIKSPKIALAPEFVNGRQPVDDIKAVDVLDAIDVVPFLYSVDVYGPFLDAAAASGRAFYPFSYDWRRDNAETAATFAEFLADVSRKHGGAKAEVVSHSMGGLVTLAVLNDHPELFRSVVFAGAPFKGGIGFLHDLHGGEPTGFNGEVLGPEVLATFPSVFSLFPLAHEAIVDAAGKPVAVDFFDADDWRRLKLGMYAPGRAPTPAYDAFLGTALAGAKVFRQRLVFKPNVVYPPVLIVASKAHPTLVKAVLGGPKSVLGLDEETAPKAPGDGRVAFETAMPPAGIAFDLELTDSGHADLLNDKRVAKRVLEFIGN